MAHLIRVGEEAHGSKFSTLITTMSNSSNFHSIKTHWSGLANELDVSPEVKQQIQDGILLKNFTSFDIIEKLLYNWRSKKSNQATLDKLMSALDKHDLGDLADKLREKYNVQLQQVPYPGQGQTVLQQYHVQHIPHLPQPHQQYSPTVFGTTPGQNAVLHFSGTQQTPMLAYPQYLPNYGNPTHPQKLSQPDPAAYPSYLQNQHAGSATATDSSGNDTSDGIVSDMFGSFTRKKFTDVDVGSRTILVGSDLNVFLHKSGNQTVEKKQPDYAMTKGFSGYALILNIMRFPSSQYRHGAQYDSIRMKQLLIQLGYQILVYDDVNANYNLDDILSIFDIFKAQIKKGPKPPSILVFIGSQGKLNKITLSDGKDINIYRHIVYQFDHDKMSELKGVPKIFILQCCRDSNKSDSGFANIDNTLICYATLPNNVANRNEIKGTLYIESLVRIFCEHAYCRHLKEMLELVEIDVGLQPIQYEERPDHQQQPNYENLGLFGVLYFNF